MKRRPLVAAAALAPAAWPLRTQAAYPSKPIRLIVGFAPARADVKAKYAAAGAEVQPRGAAEFAACVKAEAERWSALIAQRNIKVE